MAQLKKMSQKDLNTPRGFRFQLLLKIAIFNADRVNYFDARNFNMKIEFREFLCACEWKSSRWTTFHHEMCSVEIGVGAEDGRKEILGNGIEIESHKRDDLFCISHLSRLSPSFQPYETHKFLSIWHCNHHEDKSLFIVMFWKRWEHKEE